MRKLSFFLVALLTIGMMACAQNNKKQDQTVKQEEQKQETKNMKSLVAYFSASGVTQGVAKQLAEVIGADLHEIEPAVRYTEADLDWRNEQSRSSVEMKDPLYRPAMTNMLDDIADYDIIYVGFPIWWYTAPTIINTFIETYDFTGKIIVPFATSGGSSIQKACEDLKAAYSDYKFAEGRLLNDFDKEEVKAWAASIK